MNKLALDLEELRVDSFATATDGAAAEGYRWSAWSDGSICPTTAPSERRACP